jgi:hypothetical protein
LSPQPFDLHVALLTGAIGLASAIVVSILTAIISVRLALQRFRAEKYWELKAEAYAKIIEAVHDASAFARQHLEADIEGREISDDRKIELQGRARAGADGVSRAVNTGALLLPNQAIDRLRQYLRDSNACLATTDWSEYLEIEASAADKCLRNIIDIARRDLQVR